MKIKYPHINTNNIQGSYTNRTKVHIQIEHTYNIFKANTHMRYAGKSYRHLFLIYNTNLLTSIYFLYVNVASILVFISHIRDTSEICNKNGGSRLYLAAWVTDLLWKFIQFVPRLARVWFVSNIYSSACS